MNVACVWRVYIHIYIHRERERERERERYFVYTSSECLFACKHVTMSRQKEKGGVRSRRGVLSNKERAMEWEGKKERKERPGKSDKSEQLGQQEQDTRWSTD